MIDITRAAVIKAVKAGENSRSIALRLGVSSRRVNQIRSEQGISSPRGQPRCRAWSPKTRKKIERECKKRRELCKQLEYYSYAAIGRRYGITANTVHAISAGGYFSWPLEKKDV